MLTDAGPLIALINDRDQYHAAAQEAVNALKENKLFTACPCLVEALRLLGQAGGYRYQCRLLDQVDKQTLQIHHLTAQEEKRVAQLMEQYRDRPMSYADASLVALAEARRIRQIFTFDSDFHFYRLADGSPLEVLP